MDFEIRSSQVTDFNRIFEIWIQHQESATGRNIAASEVHSLKENLSRLFLNTSESTFYVAVLESKIIGWHALLPVIANPTISRYAAQTSTYVDTQFFNQGVASRLVRHGINKAKQLGIDHIYYWIRTDNPSANKAISKFESTRFVIPARNKMPEFYLYVITP